MAKEAGLQFVPHSANRSLVTVFTLHLMGALENAGPYVEFSIEPDSFEPWQAGLYFPALHALEGKVQIPEGPGWGSKSIRHGLNLPKEFGVRFEEQIDLIKRFLQIDLSPFSSRFTFQ